MIGRALDDNNDIFIEGGSFRTVSDGAQTVQHVRTRLQFYLEEWFLDLTAGTPWFQEIFTKPARLGNIESILKQHILQTPDVLLLNNFAMDFDEDTRALLVTFSAETTFGVIDNTKVTING